jgi:hypothetical protein
VNTDLATVEEAREALAAVYLRLIETMEAQK